MPPEINNTIEDINSTVSSINTSGGRNLPQLTPITPEDIATPEGDLALPDAAPESDVAGELAGLEAMPDEFVSQLERTTETAEEAKDSSLDSYLSTLLTQPGETEATDLAYRRAGVDNLKNELLDINDQMRREQLSARRRIERVKENMEGRSATAIQNEVRRVENESYQKQADLAIIQLSRQGRYDSAKEIADRAVAVQMEQQKRVLDARALIYQNNKDIFTTAEQREFETKQNDRQRRLQSEQEQRELLQTTKLEAMQMAQANGAPATVLAAIQSAENPLEVLERGGQWASVDMLEQQYKRTRNAIAVAEYGQLQATLNGEGEITLTAEDRKKIAAMPESKSAQALMTLNQNMTRLQDLYETYGTWNPVNRQARSKINSLKAQLEIDIAVAGGQGAISDQEGERYANIVGGGFFQKGSSVATAIGEAIQANDLKIKNNLEFVEAAIPGSQLFEPFAQFTEQKAAEAYVESELGTANVPTTDDAAINQWLSSNSTPAL